MKKYIAIALLLVSLHTSGQKMEKPIVDAISGDTTWRTSTEKLYAKASMSGTVGEQLYVTALKIKGTLLLTFSVQTGKTSIFSVNEGQKVFIKLKDGKVRTLSALGDNNSKHNSVSYGSNSNCTYQINSEDAMALITSDIEYIRLEYSGGTFEYPIKEKFAGNVKDIISLITRL